MFRVFCSLNRCSVSEFPSWHGLSHSFMGSRPSVLNVQLASESARSFRGSVYCEGLGRLRSLRASTWFFLSSDVASQFCQGTHSCGTEAFTLWNARHMSMCHRVLAKALQVFCLLSLVSSVLLKLLPFVGQKCHVGEGNLGSESTSMNCPNTRLQVGVGV